MRVCLIYPSTDHMITTNLPTIIENISGCYPPLGLLYVAGAIVQAGVHDVCIIDCVAEKLNQVQLKKRILALDPDIVGIQAITFSMVDAIQVARTVKSIAADIPVLMGGPHVNLYPNETISLREVDYLLLGEGENNINLFLDALGGRKSLKTIPGIVYNLDGKVRYGPPNLLIDNLDSLPMPARHLLKPELYFSSLGQRKYMTTIMSSRGCPAKCIFCDRPHLGKRFRYRSAESVVNELEFCLSQFGICEFTFYDDTFTVNRKRVFDICEQIEEKCLKISWSIRARISTVDRPMLKALRKGGCKRIHFGIESGSEKVLKILRKGINLERAKNVFKWCSDVGLETLAYFMIGSPGEGHADVQRTINYALTINCDYIHVAMTTPFPGTELYRMGLAQGLYEKDYWGEFARNPYDKFTPKLWEESLSRDEIVKYVFDFYRKFYRRPSYIVQRLMKVRSYNELLVKAKAGISLLRNIQK